jgi:hypothetical protein
MLDPLAPRFAAVGPAAHLVARHGRANRACALMGSVESPSGIDRTMACGRTGKCFQPTL